MSATPNTPPPLLGESPAFLEMLEHVSRAAPLSKPILVVGERGSGKELVAARLHFLSRRWDRAFIKLNCATLTESLLESELFGHEAGAFTGASRRHQGRFELADDGTLFLDEIATASQAVQEKILRAIEYGEIERVGGRETLQVDVRVIGATNADLPALADAGSFRADLLDRLAFDVITVPPLRHRREDIPLLAEHFGVNMARELGWTVFPGFAEQAMDKLLEHEWPGNVRELKNTVERSVYRTEPGRQVREIVLDPFTSPHRPRPMTIPRTVETPSPTLAAPAHADGEIRVDGTGGSFLERVQAYEIELLQRALRDCQFQQKRAAESLGLTYHQFRNYLRKYRLTGSRT